MGDIRSALYLDFDNVFSGLMKLDPAVAMRFGQEPGEWLRRLADPHGRRPRRWLVLRCYMNPTGVVPHPQSDQKVPLSRFRRPLTDAGFEVVDCPRLSHTKNGADIRLVIDAVEALRADAHYDEFVIASGDSDMTPLLVRLRAADRGVTLISPSDSAVVMQAVADQFIGGDDLLELFESRDVEADDELDEAPDESAGVPQLPVDGVAESEAAERFRARVLALYELADEPLVLSTLAHTLIADLGPVAKSSGWFGHETFGRAIKSLELPGVRVSQHHLWDGHRHAPPQGDAAVHKVTDLLKITPLPPESWRGIYESLATFIQGHEFNLSEASRWSRDRLIESGVRVNRPSVGLVARGAGFGGAPLFRQPPPTSDEIGGAFVSNLLDRVAAADLELTDEEKNAVRGWFGVLGEGSAVAP